MALIECPTCKESKSKHMFIKCKHTPGGRRRVCFPCEKLNHLKELKHLKTCPVCKTTKYAYSFDKCNWSKDGRKKICLVCTKESAVKYTVDNPKGEAHAHITIDNKRSDSEP